jgi:hypothetical protein
MEAALLHLGKIQLEDWSAHNDRVQVLFPTRLRLGFTTVWLIMVAIEEPSCTHPALWERTLLPSENGCQGLLRAGTRRPKIGNELLFVVVVDTLQRDLYSSSSSVGVMVASPVTLVASFCIQGVPLPES